MKELSFLNDSIPNVVDEIMMYFAAKEGETIEQGKNRNLQTLARYFKDEFSFDIMPYYKEFIALCESLCEVTPLVRFYQDTYVGFKNCYYWNEKIWNGKRYYEMTIDERAQLFRNWENAVFGPRYIYKKYRDFVLPIVHTNCDMQPGIGTGFIVGYNMVATARHCIEGATSIAVGKIGFDKYKNAVVYYHNNPNIDVAIIKIEDQGNLGFQLGTKCEIFEKVVTMGYPKIPGFTCFQTAEEAVVSATPDERFTVTEGQVAAEAQQLWSRENLFLVTAKVKGGNSGGPVINKYGHCIGVVSEKPMADGDYDDLGYGTVVPARFILEMAENLLKHQQVDGVNFVEYKE